MKRFMKNCAVIALIFASLGTLLALAGGSVAGKSAVSQAVKTATKGRVRMDPVGWWGWNWDAWDNAPADMGIVERETAVGQEQAPVSENHSEAAAGSYEDGNPVEFISEYAITKGDVDRFCPGRNIHSLSIDVGGCEFIVDNSSDEYIYLEAVNTYKFQSYLKGDTLYIKASSDSKDWPSARNCSIFLSVPSGYEFDEVEASIGAGCLSFNDLLAEDISLEVGAGQITMLYAEARQMEIHIGAGSLDISYVDVDQLEAEIGMGELYVTGAVKEKAGIECSMGNVELCLEGRETSYNYDIEGALGNIDINGRSFGGFAQERKIDNQASREIEVECAMGNVSISFME